MKGQIASLLWMCGLGLFAGAGFTWLEPSMGGLLMTYGGLLVVAGAGFSLGLSLSKREHEQRRTGQQDAGRKLEP